MSKTNFQVCSQTKILTSKLFKCVLSITFKLLGTGVPTPYDPREPERGFTWAPNIGEISSYWISYVSRFLRYDHFLEDTNSGAELLVDLVDGLGYFGLHFNKAQMGAPEWARQELAKTSQHPSIKDSFALLIGGRSVGHFR